MSHHIHPLENCLARILIKDTDAQPIPSGTGVALHGNRVLTCAHVIKTALKLPNNSKEKPEHIIVLDFPLSGSQERVTAKVGFWDDEIDLAELLVIESFPPEVIPTSMQTPDELWDHRVQAFGFPSQNLEGTWADCRLRGSIKRGWVEVFDPNTTGNFIKQGFSGGPVWDSDLKCVIGIIVAVDRSDEARVGYLIPAHKILEKWQELPVSTFRTKSILKKEIPDLIPYLVNRQKQEADLSALYKNNDPQKPLPMVVIVHGDDTQAQDMFRERMRNHFLPRLLKTNPRQTPTMEPACLLWPTYIESVNELSGEFTRSLGEEFLHDTECSCKEIQQVLAAYNIPTIVEIELLTSDWMKHDENGEDVLNALLDFWNNWPTLVPRQNLFVFIYITHGTSNISQDKIAQYAHCKQKISTQLTQYTFDNFDGLHGKVLAELKNISLTETRHWARTVAQEYFHGEITMLMAKIRELFEDDEPIAMEILAAHLKEILSTSGD